MGLGNDVRGNGGIFVPRGASGFRDNDALISNLSMVSDERDSVHLPLPKRYPPVGLKNWGNTCYANAALQCLLSTALARALLEPKCFREFQRYASNVDLLTKELQPSHSSSSDDNELSKKKNTKRYRKQDVSQTCLWITKELTYLCQYYTGDPSRIKPTNTGFLSYFTKQPAVLDPGGITRKVTKLSSCLQVGRQEDSHEFLRALISNLVMDGQNRKLSALFDGLLESAVTCQTCGHSSLRRDRYMDISLEIKAKSITDLHGAFKRFTTTELLSPDNMVTCEKCEVKRRVTKGLRLATAPTILVCHLKRFDYDLFGRVVRLNKKVDFPLRLEIGEFMSLANRSSPPPYELVSVLVHQGRSCDSGHYLSYVKSAGEWYKASDEVVEKVPISVVLAQRAYICVYEVEGMRNHKIRHPSCDSQSFEGSVPSRSVGSTKSVKTTDSAFTARSEPTILSSIFHLMGSCGVLPNEIDCCNVNINKVQSEDERNRVRRTMSDQQDRKKSADRRKKKRRPRSSHTNESSGIKSYDNDISSTICSPPSETDVTQFMQHRNYSTNSEPTYYHNEDEDNTISSLQVERDLNSVSNVEKQNMSLSPFIYASENSVGNSCHSESIVKNERHKDKHTRHHTNHTQKSTVTTPERKSRPTRSILLTNSTPTKKIVRSSSSNNLRERSVEAAFAYRSRTGRARTVNPNRGPRDTQGARSLSRTRSGIKLRLRYRSPKKKRGEIVERVEDTNTPEALLDTPRPNPGIQVRNAGPVKIKRKILSKLSSSSSQLPPLPTPREMDLFEHSFH